MLRSTCRIGFVSVAVLIVVSACSGNSKSSNNVVPPSDEAGTADGTTPSADGGVLPPGATPEETVPTCQDGIDNDKDGIVDCADPSCAGLVVCVGGDAGPSPDCDCDDGLACTLDNCNVATRVCGHAVRAGMCVIAGQCYPDGAKNGSECEVCDAAINPAGWTPIIGGCTVGSICYRKGEKSTDGCSLCDPSRSVTSLSPNNTPTCNVAGRCYGDGEKESTGCEVCKVAVSTTTLQPATAACTIGGQCFEEGAKHPSLDCSSVTCNSTVSSTSWTVGGAECLIGSQCYPDGEKSANGCSACIASQSKTSWSSRTYACNISGNCYAAGESHPSPTCTSVVCDGTVSTSNWTVKGNECLISNICRQAGDKNLNACQECNPTTSKTAWSNVTGGCNIAGACYANNALHPSPSCKTTTCNTASSTSSWTIAGNECLIGNVCYAAGDKAPGSCQECNPSLSKTTWSPSATSCVIGGVCYSNGTAHPSATCTGLGVTCNSSLSTTNWSITGNACVINNQCYANGALDPTGCAKCDTAVSKTSWTPQATCTNIVMAALNGAHTGALGGISGANSLCATEAAAAGYGGTWKAFLSSSTQNVNSLITGTNASTLPVVNTHGEPLWANWNTVFTQPTWGGSYYLWTFGGKFVDEGNATPAVPDWSDADGWHGSTAAGLMSAAYTCNDWSNGTSSYNGANGEWDFRQMFNGETSVCSTYHAVACVRVP